MKNLNPLLLISIVTINAINPTTAPAANAKSQPNIVYILADDLGYGDLGVLGQKKIKTPNIDRLAREGMTFTQHYSGSTVCAPSRSCLMTGLHTGHTYIRGNGDGLVLRADPHDITVGRILSDAGYNTAMIGKNCTSCDIPEDLMFPNKKGFDHFYGVMSHKEAHHYFPPRVYRDGTTIDLPGNSNHTGDQYAHDLFIDDAVDWLKNNAGNQQTKPFFMLYSACIPHASLTAPEEWIAKYRGQFPERTLKQAHYAGTEEPNATFAAMVSRLDWEVGRILDTLKQSGVDNNTIVMFASDNGAHSAGGHSENDFNSSGPLRGEKRDLYEGGIRTPFFVRWPGTIKPNSKSDHISAFWDVLPTACELAGIDPPANLDGISFAPTLHDNLAAQQKHDYLYWEFFERGGKRAIRMGDWKIVQTSMLKKQNNKKSGTKQKNKKNASSKTPGPIEVYNLANDIAESNDVAKQHPEIVSKAKLLFQSARTTSPIERFNFPKP